MFFVSKTANDLKRAIKAAMKLRVPYFILGGGSNVLISDQGFRGIVIKIQNSPACISYTESIAGKQSKIQNSNKFVFIKAEAGVSMSRLIKFAINHGFSGLEFFLGLPGTVGGAVCGNAHFKGKQIKEIIYKTEKFAGVILSVVFRLKKGRKESLGQIAKELLDYRKKTQPLKFPSAGCIFKNPESYSAGYLIDQCGLKGTKIGGAMISKKHANFIVNLKRATCSDVLSLISICKEKVRERFEIELEEEIIKVGSFNE